MALLFCGRGVTPGLPLVDGVPIERECCSGPIRHLGHGVTCQGRRIPTLERGLEPVTQFGPSVKLWLQGQQLAVSANS